MQQGHRTNSPVEHRYGAVVGFGGEGGLDPAAIPLLFSYSTQSIGSLSLSSSLSLSPTLSVSL